MLSVRSLLIGGSISLALSACTPEGIQLADYDVIPRPDSVSLSESEEPFVFSSRTLITTSSAADSALIRNAGILADNLEVMTGIRARVADSGRSSGAIILTDTLSDPNPEAYRITVSPDRIVIDGASPAGSFYGANTLLKSIPQKMDGNVSFPSGVIYAAPRFPYRGAHLDVVRHFFPADSVKKYIDILALHGINRFHWHLTDDQGWRIEIKSRPLLAEKASRRPNSVIGHNSPDYDSVPVEGFYTQEQIRDIVRYAADRHITIIPEIDMPGHMVAALSVYPELGCTGGPYEVWRRWGISDDVLCAGNDSTYAFLDDVFGEIIDLFPSEVIHLGGDECPKVRWNDCPECQAKMKALGLKDDPSSTAAEKLQSHVTSHVIDFLASKGRRAMGWDELIDGGVPAATMIMAWQGADRGNKAAALGHDVVMVPTKYLYFDYYQSRDRENEPLAIGGFVPLDLTYSFEPCDSSLTPDAAARIQGVQANVWTEYITTFPHVQYMLLPRLAALSELQWVSPDRKDYDRFLQSLDRLTHLYSAFHYNYRPLDSHTTSSAPNP